MRLGHVLAVAAAATALILVTGQALRAVSEPPDPEERKITEAKRFLYYVVTRDGGPELRLTGGERQLQLVTHAVLPGPPPFDPARQVVYGLRLALVEGGKPVWQRDVYTRSRQSKGRRAGALWLDESAFSVERGVEVTDERMIVVRLPAEARAGATLRLSLVGEVDEGLVRVYQRVERAAARVELRLRSLSPAARAELADDLSFTPWDRLDPVERTARLRFQRMRVSAAGREGEDYRTRALYVTDFRLPIEEDPPLAGTLVTPARAAAWNIVGPVELRLEVARGPSEAPSFVPATLDIRSVGEGGQPERESVPVPPAPTTTARTLSVPAGLHSLQLTTDAREGVRVILAAPAGAQAQLGVPSVDAAEELLAPHEILLPATLLDAGSPPLAIDVVGPDDLLSRVLRIDARLLPADAAPPGSPIEGAVVVTLLDGQGRRVGGQTVPLTSVISAFEEARSGAGARIVAEPTSFRLIVPPATRRAEVRVAQPTLVRAHTLLTFTPAPDQLAPPFDAVQLQTTTWRYAPFDERSWVPVLPANRGELRDREAKLAAQVRLEALPPPFPPPGTKAASVVPEGQPELQTVIERARPEEGAGWQPGWHTPLRAGRAQKLRFAGGAARLMVWALGPPEESLGHDVRVDLDGRELTTNPLTATRSTFTLPDVAAGAHTVTVQTDVNGLRLLIDQPSAGGGETVALRTVYQVGGGGARLKLSKPSAAPMALDIVVYGTERDGDPRTQLRISVDGGAPRRVEGVALQQITPAVRVVPLPPADREPILGFADLADRTVYHPRLIAVVLGDDVGAGAHTVTVQPQSGGRGMWMRFFAMTTAGTQPEKAIQWRLLPLTGVAHE